MTQIDTGRENSLHERDPQVYTISGAAMAVHGQLGPGFLESAYQEPSTADFEIADIPCRHEVPLETRYRDRVLSCRYKADPVCYDSVIVELKAGDRLDTVHQAQVINYRKTTGLQRALLLNFGSTRLEYKRIVLNYRQRSSASSADETQNADDTGR